MLRALRDFNLGKLAADDRSIFLGLLNDLFPGVPETVPQAVDVDFSAKVLACHPTHTHAIPVLLICVVPCPHLQRMDTQHIHTCLGHRAAHLVGCWHASSPPHDVTRAQIREAAIELGYQPDPTFCLKVAQLREIFCVRWSVFLLGPAGCGKTAIWRTLARAQQLAGEKTVTRPINPKAWLSCWVFCWRSH